VRSVFLVDAGFNRPLDHAKEVLREIIRRRAQLQLYCVFDPGPADREFFRLFRRASGLMVTMFAESLSDAVLSELRKSFGMAEIMRDAQTMREEGVACLFTPTFGSPGETRETVAEMLKRTPSLKATMEDFSVGWRIQPRAPLPERAVADGVIRADDDCWEPRFYISPHTPRERLEKEIGANKRRHPFGWARMIPFIVRASAMRPWKWGPEEV